MDNPKNFERAFDEKVKEYIKFRTANPQLNLLSNEELKKRFAAAIFRERELILADESFKELTNDSQQEVSLSLNENKTARGVLLKEAEALRGETQEYFFENILTLASPIHYKKEARKYTEDKSLKRMSEPLYANVCIKHFLKLVREKEKRDVRVDHEQLFIFNGKYWKGVKKQDVKDFLRKFAKKTGVPVKLEKPEFSKRLYETLLDFAGVPPKPRATGTAKINLLNGTLVIDKGGAKIRKHDPNDFLKHLLDYSYDPEATCPEFDKFFNEILPDKSGQNLFFEHVGAGFFKHGHGLKLEKGLILYGKTGANGKSTALEATTEVIGRENVSFEKPDDLFNPNTYALPSVEGKLLNIANEITKTINGSKMKEYLTGEPLPTRQIYGERYTITDYPKMIISANELPRTAEIGNSYFRRWHILPFDVEIPLDDRDPDKLLKITEGQKPGILNHIIKAIERLNKNRRFSKCKASDKAVEQYKKDGDTVLDFLEEKGYKKSDSQWLKWHEVYSEYKEYCDEVFYKGCGKSSFLQRMDKAGHKGEKGKYYTAPNGKKKERFYGLSFKIEIKNE